MQNTFILVILCPKLSKNVEKRIAYSTTENIIRNLKKRYICRNCCNLYDAKQLLSQHYYFKTLTVDRTIELAMKSLKRSTKSVNNQNIAIHSKYVFSKKKMREYGRYQRILTTKYVRWLYPKFNCC